MGSRPPRGGGSGTKFALWALLRALGCFPQSKNLSLRPERGFGGYSTLSSQGKIRGPRCAATVPIDPRAVDIPPRQTGISPKVEHFLVHEEKEWGGGEWNEVRRETLGDYLEHRLGVDERYVRGLLKLGAVWYTPVPPVPKDFLPNGAKRRALSARARRLALLPPGTKIDQNPFPPVRLTESDYTLVIESGSFLRVHCHPKRFPECYAKNWKERVVVNNEHFVIIDKPSGVPVSSTVDNNIENCLNFAARAIGLQDPLLITHRLDQVTSGVLVMGKTQSFVSFFNQLIQSKDFVEKRYKLLTLSPLPIGSHVCRISELSSNFVSRKRIILPNSITQSPSATEGDNISATERDTSATERDTSATERDTSATERDKSSALGGDSSGGKLCALEVETSVPFRLGKRPEGKGWDNWNEGDTAYESTVRLLTGRTHQIRAIAQFFGSPILGDCLYSSISDTTTPTPPSQLKMIALQASELCIKLPPKGPDGSIVWESIEDERLRSILQSREMKLLMGNSLEKRRFAAGEPWWHSKHS